MAARAVVKQAIDSLTGKEVKTSRGIDSGVPLPPAPAAASPRNTWLRTKEITTPCRG
jgi:hypothetical protein